MATRASIEFDFRLAIEQADKIDELADSLEALSSKKLAGTMQDIANNWKGERAGEYVNKGAQLQTRMSSSASTLKGIASDIRTIAKRVYDAEMAALEIAEARTY